MNTRQAPACRHCRGSGQCEQICCTVFAGVAYGPNNERIRLCAVCGGTGRARGVGRR